MLSNLHIAAVISCAVLLSSCRKEEAPVTTHPPESGIAITEGPTQIPDEKDASPEAQVRSVGSNPVHALPSREPDQPLAGRGWHTPTEAQFISGDALDVALIGRALQGKWSETVQQMKGDAVADQDAIELTRTYESYIKATLGQFDGLKLKEFACGITLCAGTIISSDKSAYTQWQKNMLSIRQPPVFSFVDMEIRAQSSIEQRFAFSSDATAPGLSGRR